MKKNIFKNCLVVGIILLFVCSSFASSISVYSEIITKENNDVEDFYEIEKNVILSCRTYGTPIKSSREIEMSYLEAKELLGKINKLVEKIAYNPSSDETEKLQNDIISDAKEYKLLPEDISLEELQPRLFTQLDIKHSNKGTLPVIGNRGTASFCNFATAGEGSQFPIIILPRLIPILLTPIPRAFLHWSANIGVTTCGSYLTGTGFIASGMQRGTALGFWGIGFSVFLPPFRAYGFIGYALFATCTAEEIEPWPPNYAPEVSAVSPSDGAENVAISTSELSFKISDSNGDKMDYIVTTEPDIGSGSENNNPDGTYSIPISGLEGTEEYTWIVQVTDGEKTVNSSFSFETEPVAPVVSDPSPIDGARHVHFPLSHLTFQIEDPQDDLMDYTVETSPDIGSDSAIGVSAGKYTLYVSNVEYSTEYNWYVNVTDGVNWKHKVFSFTTEEEPFDPFEKGWQYRKQITINHTKVEGDLTKFPALISVVDTDFRDKAQDDGDDILFMEKTGISRRLFHEIEKFDGLLGELVAWINVLSLSSTVDTSLYIYYGNPNSTNQENIEDVWDYNYKGVWHLQETFGEHYDSTIHDNDGISNIDAPGTQDASGQINGADYFDGDNDYIEFGDNSDFDITGDITISLWFKTDTPQVGVLVNKLDHINPDNGFCLIMDERWWNPSGTISFLLAKDSVGPSEYDAVQTDSTFNDNKWHYLTALYSPDGSSRPEIYVDGIVQSLSYFGNPISSIGPSPGCHFKIAEYSPENGHFNYKGSIDEVRISKITRGESWISTEYNNQNNPESFLSFGPEETAQ